MSSSNTGPTRTHPRPLQISCRRAAIASIACAAAAVCLLAPPTLGGPAEVVIRQAPPLVPPLTAQEKQRVQQAIDRGVAFLRRTQLPTGSWIIGNELVGERYGTALCFPAGFAGLGGLALLESDVPADDPAVQAAARFVRLSGPRLFRTYEVTLAVLFLDRLGDARDRPLLRALALRLAAGQTALGGWGYNCPLLNSTQEKRLQEALRKKTRADLPARLQPPFVRGRCSDGADNSNTQFAILALGAARRHGLPLDFTLGLLEQRFRLSQDTPGWDYHWLNSGLPARGYGSMTCAGLLGLAVGRAAADEEAAREAKAGQARPQDPGITSGLKVLGDFLRNPSDPVLTGDPRGGVNLYFLWSVERVGVLCGVKTIGGTDWYRWGAGLLVPTQRRDGSWLGRGSGGFPVADTCFALLFLKRSDLLPDLRQELAKRVKIVDPGPFVQGGLAKKGSHDPKGLRPDPGLPDLKGLVGGKGAAAEDGPLAVDLGKVQVGKPTPLPLRVRGPADFRITGVRGEDKQLKVQLDSQSTTVHDLTVTLHLDKAGAFEYTLTLQTDLPGRAEVTLRVRVTATPAGPR